MKLALAAVAALALLAVPGTVHAAPLATFTEKPAELVAGTPAVFTPAVSGCPTGPSGRNDITVSTRVSPTRTVTLATYPGYGAITITPAASWAGLSVTVSAKVMCNGSTSNFGIAAAGYVVGAG